MAVTSQELKAFRRQTAKDEAPWIAGSVAGITVLFAVTNSVVGPEADISKNIPTLLTAAVFALASLVFRTGRVPASVVPWTAAALAVLLVWALLLQEYNNFSSTGLAYSLFVVAIYAPITLDILIALTAAVPMLIGCVLVSISLHSQATSDWILTSLAAFFISGVLLWARIRGVNDLARALAIQATMATRDSMTQLLNRLGFEDQIVRLFALAAREDSTVAAMFIDINDLKAVNDTYGHQAGDRVILSVAQALKIVVRAGDLVARWGGDEFLVVGLGNGSNPDEIQARLCEELSLQGIDRSIWPGDVTVGNASIDPKGHTFDELIYLADMDMYRRKSRPR